MFTDLSFDSKSENKVSSQNLEIDYFMLDIIFLLGDPKESLTIMDNPLEDGHFYVGEYYPPLKRITKKVLDTYPDKVVRIDRTS